MLPMDFCNMFPPSEREERAMRLLKRVSLEDVAHKLPAAVSGGQQQSAAVARALANDPPIIIADEPTGNLDSKTAEEIMQLFEELESQGKTLLMVTHDSTLAQRTSRTLLISDGEMVKEAVARAFPTLPHEQMLRLSHSAREMILQPGEPVPEIHPEKQPVYVVSRGTLEVYPDKTSQSSGVPAATIQTWKYLDPFEWDNKNPASLQLRAGPTTPLLLVVLEREDLSGAGGLIAPAPEQAEPQKKERNDWLSRLWRKP
jgi:ABC-type glutathione transport system ATPase component